MGDLHPADYNPRKISEKAASGLKKSLEKFGDIGGITWNVRTGNLVTGHQRVASLMALHGEALKIEQTATGADLVTPSGDRFPIRLVDWPESREKAANVAANNQHIAGKFTPELDDLLREIQLDDEIEFEDLCFEDLLDTDIDAGDDDEAPKAPPEDPGVDRYQEQFGVTVICRDEAHQAEVYDKLQGEGYDCRVVVT